MAPKRGANAKAAAAAAAQAPPLTGCTIAVSGTFPGVSQAAVAELIAELGGTFVKSVTQDCTHLVATSSEVQKQTAKIKTALSKPDVRIVNLSWIQSSEANNARAPEDDHLAAPGPTAAVPQIATNGKTNVGSLTGHQQTNGQSKRSASPDTLSSAPLKKQKTQPAAPAKPKAAPAAKAKAASQAKHVNIPQAEGVNSPSHRVYVSPDGTIYDASLNQTNSSNNNNKFYRIQVLHQPSTGAAFTWTRWGRVGDFGQTATLGRGDLDDAIKQFEKKFKDKSGLKWDDRMSDPKPAKYTYLERSYGESSDEEEPEAGNTTKDDKGSGQSSALPPSKLEAATQDLMKLIFNQDFFNEAMKEMNYDVNKLPLGKLSKTTISRGYQALKDLSEVMDDPTLAMTRYSMHLAAASEHLSNLYYSLIPHAFGRNRPPVINSNAMLKREIELLESLADMKDAAQILKVRKEEDDIHPLDRQFQGLGLEEMTPLASTSAEFTELKNYLCESVGATHGMNYHVENIFRIERQGECERFKTEFGDAPQDRRLLWHGSRCTNFAGILSQGLRIAPPEAPVSGYMFGKGIYLADMSSKSANYCAAYASNGHALLLLCEAELGEPIQTLTNADYDAGDKAKKQGMLSTWGQGSTGPQAWKDAGCVHPSLEGVRMPDMAIPAGPTNIDGAYLLYNEYIVYDVSQVRLRYLLRVKL
ncbi:PARP-domain-containing protein [Coniochaeta ligniaria NRRL 30616]|uniref:Poly [ADP-ribose] polymerase n=1 Tax=Coniochaeta ligniaria NRRL 30616 TaxID=1408157 RepID=A0A1J7ILE1_9PEZI|nr:PARP-domain-containing protein [Coniochaeta ligniaria NRRL 30616]